MNLPENSIIKFLLGRAHYDEYRTHIDVKSLPPELANVLRVVDSLHAVHEDDIALDDLANIFFGTLTSTRDRETYLAIFDTIRSNEANDDSVIDLIRGLKRARLLQDLSMLAYDASEGRKTFDEVLTLTKQLEDTGGTSNEAEVDEDERFVSSSLVQLHTNRVSVPGLRWRLSALNRALGSLRPGDFGFIFARPETGKTTFLASEVSYMAEQMADGDSVLWFVNEEQGDKVMLRAYQASLGIDQVELYRDLEGNEQKFLDKTHNVVKMLDKARIHYKTVERLCAKYKPKLVVIDQIDKIVGFDNDREDLRLGAIYIWAREIAKTYCPVIAVCQADGSGEGQKWLTMANVANAKTSKQAEADWILGIGKVHDNGYEAFRYLNISKNKLDGDDDSDPTMRHGKMAVKIAPDIARYIDFEAN